MAFVLARPASPNRRDSFYYDQHGSHASTHPFPDASSSSTPTTNLTNSQHHHPSASTSHGPSLDHPGSSSTEMYLREKEKSHLEIVVNSDIVCLRGSSTDVPPALLSGHVALYLAEAMSIKEITLQFRGKATQGHGGSSPDSGSGSTSYVVCTHDWSFLEGEKKHAHTLKAGRHLFPFQLQLGGTLPASLTTPALGGASIVYKLRAQATRPGLAHSLTATLPLTLIRGPTADALEYQQTLEIENTWPEKLMYAILLPHKAWAAGDTITTLVKFMPIAKGARVVRVTTSVVETTKMQTRLGMHEESRVAALTAHDFIDGHPVVTNRRGRPSPSTTPGQSTNVSRSNSSEFLRTTAVASTDSAGPSGLAIEDDNGAMEDVVATLTLPLPEGLPPSHSVEPFCITHRIRWVVAIMNAAGYVSELRASLPLQILDGRLLPEALSHSYATRRLLIPSLDPLPSASASNSADNGDAELPSYKAHVRDRVANMFLPESATMRVTNPWVANSVSPVVRAHAPAPPVSSFQAHRQQLDPRAVLAALPHAPGAPTTPLDWVNSELLLSLSTEVNPRVEYRSPTSSTPSSLHASRRNSRAGSPEPLPLPPPAPSSTPHDTHVHTGGTNRIGSLLSASIKPFATHWRPRVFNSHSVPAALSMTRPNEESTEVEVPVPDARTGSMLLHRAFTAVPDYGVAARGFLGGVPPLESMRGLPSYEEAARQSTTTPSP